MNDWVSVSSSLPPKNLLVETKIDDMKGERNHAQLFRGGQHGNVWFVKSGDMYVYYVPTHWRLIT